MLVLGLDPSLRAFGWALHDTEASKKARCVARGLFSTSSHDIFVDRYVSMRESLRKLLQETRPDKVGIESPIFNDLFSEGMYGLFLYSNEALKLERKDVVYFSPGQGKAHARESLVRPKGWKMLKGDMVAAARADTGGGTWNHNEADAYLIARLAGRFWGYSDGLVTESQLSPVERKQFTEVHTYTRGVRAGKTVRRGLVFREDDRFFRWSETSSEPGTA